MRLINQTMLFMVLLSLSSNAESAEVPARLTPWLEPQSWTRDTDGPVISLGETGDFDDTHMFAPAVANTPDGFQLWYCGSRGTVARRVFALGLATSSDGRVFRRHSRNPVFEFGDGKHSVLTPTLLRRPDGTVLRENGRLRMWFSSTWFEGTSGLHQLHETSSTDGIHWDVPSDAQLSHVYAPTILKSNDRFEMWYSDVRADPWIVRHAVSADGRKWQVTQQPVLVIDQDWERSRLFYPTVLKIDDVYLMWYGSYSAHRPQTTSLGFAVSADGIQWYKHPDNPVLVPDPNRPWESHYVTSQSVMRLPDGRFRMWYASRRKPPFLNKYFAINTAVWNPDSKEAAAAQEASRRVSLPRVPVNKFD